MFFLCFYQKLRNLLELSEPFQHPFINFFLIYTLLKMPIVNNFLPILIFWNRLIKRRQTIKLIILNHFEALKLKQLLLFFDIKFNLQNLILKMFLLFQRVFILRSLHVFNLFLIFNDKLVTMKLCDFILSLPDLAVDAHVEHPLFENFQLLFFSEEHILHIHNKYWVLHFWLLCVLYYVA